MPNIFDGFLKQLGTGDTVKDFKHASQLYVSDNYRLAPKYSWLYFVKFDFSSSSQFAESKQLETGMLVKGVTLPSFRVNSRNVNSYNRKEVIQTKLEYNPVQFTFHDDSADVVRHFWFDYMTHYYRDTDLGYKQSSSAETPPPHDDYLRDNKYDYRNLRNFGYTPRHKSGNAHGSPNYLEAIRIYSLHNKRFSEYTLLNPIITDFTHGQHDARSYSETLQHTMIVEFNTVLYATGDVNTSTVNGFGDAHYDKSPSPLTPQGGGVTSIFGPGGFVNAIDTVLSQDGRTADGGINAKGIGGALFTTARAFQNAKTNNVDFKNLAKLELTQAVKSVISNPNFASGGVEGAMNTLKSQFFIPQGLRGGSDQFLAEQSGVAIDQPDLFPAQPGLSNANAVTSNGDGIFANDIAAMTSPNAPVEGKPGIDLGADIPGATTASDGSLGGAPINSQVQMNKETAARSSGRSAADTARLNPLNQSPTTKVSASGSTTTPTESGFFGAVKTKGTELFNSAKSAFSQGTRALTGSNKINFTESNPIGQPAVFTTGTNLLKGGIDSLAQTPFSKSVIRAAGADTTSRTAALTNVAGSEAQKFVNTGNKTNLVFGQRVATSTNPAPTQTAGINLSGDIPT